jgi:hypothetical protein
MAVLERELEERFHSPLPSPNQRIRRKPMFEEMNRPSGFNTLFRPCNASTTPGIVHIVKVLTTVSTHESPSRIRSVEKLDVEP